MSKAPSPVNLTNPGRGTRIASTFVSTFLRQSSPNTPSKNLKRFDRYLLMQSCPPGREQNLLNPERSNEATTADRLRVGSSRNSILSITTVNATASIFSQVFSFNQPTPNNVFNHPTGNQKWPISLNCNPSSVRGTLANAKLAGKTW